VKSRAMRSTVGGLLSVLVLFAGCSDDDSNDWQRLVCDVQSVNEGLPLISAYLNAGADNLIGTADDYQPIDSVMVIFHARPYGSTIVLPEDGAFSWFQVETYDLYWETDPGAPVDLTPYNVMGGNADAMVPVYEEAAASILVVGTDMKSAAWFVDLYNGVTPSFQADARLVFHGHESGSDEEVSLEAGLRVSFIPVVSEN